jgi:hypothetical protein
MSAFIKFKPSGSQDVVSYTLYHRPDEANVPLTKDNSNLAIGLGNPAADADGFIKIELNAIPELTDLEGTYDLGIAAVDDAGNISPLLTSGLVDVSLDFLAPSPPSEASVYWN